MPTKQRRRWTDEEIAILEVHYPIGGAVACRDAGLDRTSSGIRYMASKLGVTWIRREPLRDAMKVAVEIAAEYRVLEVRPAEVESCIAVALRFLRVGDLEVARDALIRGFAAFFSLDGISNTVFEIPGSSSTMTERRCR
jgi:hypothetical protein